MNFLSRMGRVAKPVPAEAPRIIHREIEITVEREWITVGYAAQPPGSAAVAEPESLLPVPPPAAANE